MTFGLLALITVAGLAGPLLAALPRLGLPLVVGEIGVGVLLGRTGLGWIDAGEPTTAFLSEVGFAMLMFVVGTHLPLRHPGLRSALATVAGTSILIAGFTAGAVLAAVGEPRRLAQQLVGVAEGFLVPLFFVTLGARLEFGALLGSGKALLLLAGLVVAATTLHVLVAIVLRRPVAVGLLATAALGVPSAVVSIGLAQGVLDAGQAAAVVSAVLATIAVSAAGGSHLSRYAGKAPR